jgi:hypothetical protein
MLSLVSKLLHLVVTRLVPATPSFFVFFFLFFKKISLFIYFLINLYFLLRWIHVAFLLV